MNHSRFTIALAWILGLACISAAEDSIRGSLLICGGGKMPELVLEKFADLAGGKQGRLVVIPTASEREDAADPMHAAELWGRFGFASIQVLHTRSRQVADDPAFSEPLKSATAVWFGGGQQSRLIAPYKDTLAHRRFIALLKRGGVIAGTSAGAAVMSHVMITGDATPLSEGFGFLPPEWLIDQHFLKRSRVNRLIRHLNEKPGLIGLGIDEATALLVEHDKTTVLGESYVTQIQTGRPAPQFTIHRPGQTIPSLKLAD